jgi:hypothetical protein
MKPYRREAKKAKTDPFPPFSDLHNNKQSRPGRLHPSCCGSSASASSWSSKRTELHPKQGWSSTPIGARERNTAEMTKVASAKSSKVVLWRPLAFSAASGRKSIHTAAASIRRRKPLLKASCRKQATSELKFEFDVQTTTSAKH